MMFNTCGHDLNAKKAEWVGGSGGQTLLLFATKQLSGMLF